MESADQLIWQPSLFGAEEPTPDPGFGSLVRVELDGESWLDHAPRWMAGADRLFAEIAGGARWGRRRRRMYDRVVDEPRLTSGWRADTGEGLDPAPLEEARWALSQHYGVAFDSVGINLYRDGSDSVAWHRDRIPAEIDRPVVALLSLGEPRRFLLRPHGGGISRALMLGSGDLLVTGGQTQRRFDHSVPKVARAGPRISVAFRHGVRIHPV
jgi:alkylated DNA repair dioxygenase AlkB